MSKWDDLKKAYYGKDICVNYEGGIIDFSPDSIHKVAHGEFRSYDEYLDVQMRSCSKSRNYFEMCFYCGDACTDFKGKIDRFDPVKGKVIFKRIMVDGIYSDGTGFYGKEDHVWMDQDGFAGFQPGDCLWFSAEIYRYMRRGNGKLIDYGLRAPAMVRKIDAYMVPTDEELIDQQINQLVCETCRYDSHCSMGNCVADERERRERFETLKNFEPGKFTPFTVVLAYELEYRIMMRTGGFRLDRKSPNYHKMKKIMKICKASPIYYLGDVKDALARMIWPDKPRLYLE